MKKFTILITGGMGLLGFSMIKYFEKQKNIKKIISVDKRDIKFLKFNSAKVSYFKMDINDPKKIKFLINNQKIDVIFHTAAVTQVLDGLREPKKCYETNILGTINLLEAIRSSKKKIIFIFSSSDKAYGKLKKNNMYTESDKLLGDFTYDASKSASDIISQSFSKTYDMRIGIVRSGNIYGPGDLNLDRLIPGLAFSSLKNKKLDLRSNGKNRRDYIYVEDVVEGYDKLMKNMMLKKSKKVFIFNLGSQYNFTVIKVCNLFLNIIKKKGLQPIVKNNSRIEIPYQKLSYKKAKKELNWYPKTKFKSGIIKTYEWYKQNFKNISLLN